MKNKTITLVIPLYNEAHRVGRLLAGLEKAVFPVGLSVREVRLVDDGSTDNTAKVLAGWIDGVGETLPYRLKLISYPENRGRGYALRTGLSHITTDYGAYIDADLDIPLSNLRELVSPMRQKIDVIMGSKKMPSSVCTQKRHILRVIMGYGHTMLAGLLLGSFYWDYQGGMKAFSKSLLKIVLPKLTINRWGFDMEIVSRARQLNLTVTEVPLVWGALTEDSRVKAVFDTMRAIGDMVMIRSRVFFERFEGFGLTVKKWLPTFRPLATTGGVYEK